MFVVLVGQRAHHASLLVRDVGDRPRRPRLHAPARALALVHGALRQLRRGDGRGPRQGAGRRAAQDPARDPGQAARATRPTTSTSSRCPRPSSATRRPRAVHGRRPDPGRRRGRRGRRLGGRVRDHRRVRARDPRVAAATARRSPAAPRCSPTGSSSASPPNPGETFLDRMIALVEGASRQKTPNEIALTILLSGLTIVFLLAVVTLQPFAVYSGGAGRRAGAGRAARLPHPDHHRRPALGHRHRGHGPADPAERDRHERPRGRGGGRREHAAARQDRHHHARQPAGGRVPPGRPACASRSWPSGRSSPRCRTRRPKAAASWCWPRSGSASAAATDGRRRRPAPR